MYRAYFVFGLLVLSFLAYADYRGLGFTRYDELKSVPKSIRNNPGAYRGLYGRGYFHK
jgi:hypothetical protein